MTVPGIPGPIETGETNVCSILLIVIRSEDTQLTVSVLMLERVQYASEQSVSNALMSTDD